MKSSETGWIPEAEHISKTFYNICQLMHQWTKHDTGTDYHVVNTKMLNWGYLLKLSFWFSKFLPKNRTTIQNSSKSTFKAKFPHFNFDHQDPWCRSLCSVTAQCDRHCVLRLFLIFDHVRTKQYNREFKLSGRVMGTSLIPMISPAFWNIFYPIMSRVPKVAPKLFLGSPRVLPNCLNLFPES